MSNIERFLFRPVFPALLLAAATLFEYSGLDLWWVSRFYDFQKHSWPFKHHWFFESIIHTGGQWFVNGMILLWLVAFILTFFRPDLKNARKILFFFIIAAAAGPLLVSLGKQFTHIYTPWDLRIFNGEQPYIRLFDRVPAGAPVGHAFPAGHSSGGFAFMSLYFILLHHASPYRKYGLLFGLVLGFAFGLGQQVRGAHFPSHDLFSLMICWLAAASVYFIFYPQQWRNIKRW